MIDLLFCGKGQAEVAQANQAPLRVGLLMDGLTLPRASQQVVLDILQSSFASIELAVLKAPEAPSTRPSWSHRAWKLLTDSRRRRSLLYSLYAEYDKRRNPLSPDPLEPMDVEPLLADVPQLSVAPLIQGFTHRFTPAAVDAIRSYDLDVLLAFGFNILRGEVLEAARYGIWSYHHGDNEFYRGGPPYFWELVEQSPVSGAILQVLNEDLDAGLVLCKAQFSTVPGMWRQRNLLGPYLGSTYMVIQKLHELYEHGWDAVRASSTPSARYLGKRKIYHTPSNAEMIAWLARYTVSKAVSRPFRKPSVYHWRVGVRQRETSVEESLHRGTRRMDFSGFEWIESPRGRFWADPFLVDHDGDSWLFVEDYDYSKQRGSISVARLRQNGRPEEFRTCLDLPYHSSYPCVFRHDGELFMIPETAAADSVQLFRATNFPYEWKLEKTLFKGAALDTTPWFDGARWWFFTTSPGPEGHAVTSLLFSAESLTGEWALHPRSPISTDVRFARNAGALFSRGGRLFRPSQNCAENYGRNVWLNEILELTPERYREEPVLEILPPLEFLGGHTYNASWQFEVADVARYERASRHT